MSELGWRHLTAADKRELIERIRTGTAGSGPMHAEIHPADRCNVDCFFCSTATLRGSDEVPLRTFSDFVRELRAGGCRSVRLSGGGEPLFHREIRPLLQTLAAEELPIENLTTNGVLLNEKVLPLLLTGCDEITLSLNTADADSYAQMMQTNPRNFDRVVKNARALLSERRARKTKAPRLLVQFLVWKENYRSLGRMYDLARDIGADEIVFNGLSHLRPGQLMSPSETDEMMTLYRDVVRRDGYRTIDIINSFEQDLRPRVMAMNAELHQERTSRPIFTRARHFLGGNGFSFGQNLRHFARVRRMQDAEKRSAGLAAPCLIAWYSIVVRTSGEVGGCCILQGKSLGNAYRDTLSSVWNSAAYDSFRNELHRIMIEGDAWRAGTNDRIVEPMCGGQTAGCPIANFYYRYDAPFMAEYNRALAALSTSVAST